MVEGAVEIAEVLQHADHDHEVELLAGPGDLGERHRAHVDGIEPGRRGGARGRWIEAGHVGEPAIADACQQASAGAADVKDARRRRLQVGRNDVGNRREPPPIVLGLRASPLRVLVLGHVTVIPVEGLLIRNAVGVAAPASPAHDHVVAGDRCRAIDRRELLVEEHAARGASTDRAIARRGGDGHRALPVSRARGTA